jgi:hypothetical protein
VPRAVVAASCAALVALTIAVHAHAAPKTSIDGDVLAPNGEPIVGADVLLFDAQGNPVGKTKTDDKGHWRMALVPGAPPPIVVDVVVSGLPVVATDVPAGAAHVVTTIEAAESTDITLEAHAEKGDAAAIDAKCGSLASTTCASVYTVDATLMSKLPGTRGDPFAAATSLPSMARPPSLSTIYVVRGAGPEESGTYLDGAPISHAFHFGGFVAVVPGALIGNVALAPGGFGVSYGRATAGIIDVELAPLRSDGPHVVGSLDAIDVGVVATTPLTKTTRVAVGARRSHVDAWLGKVVPGTYAGDLPRYLDGELILEQDLSDKTRLRLGFIGADDNVDVTDPNSDQTNPRRGSWHSSLVRVHARMDARLGDGGTFLGIVSASKSSDTIIGDLDQYEDVHKQMFLRLEASAPIGEEARLTAGFDGLATHIDGVRILQVPVSGYGGSGLFPLRGTIGLDRLEPAGYAQLVLHPDRALTITPGIRVDRHYLGDAVVQPRLAVRVEAGPNTALKATAGEYARPNVYDSVNARDFMGALIPVVVDSGPAKGVQVGAGVEQRVVRGVDVLVDLYARTTQHVIVPVQGRPTPIYDATRATAASPNGTLVGYDYPLWQDTGRTRAAGMEFLLRISRPEFSAFIGYAIGRAELRETPFTPWRRAPFDQTHVLNAAAIVKLGAGWEIGARFRLAIGVLDSPYPTTDVSPKSNPDVDPNRPLPELSPISSLDVRIEKAWQVASGTLAAYIEARNVYNNRNRAPLAYNYVYGYPVMGQELPIIPNIGVRGSW